MGIVPLYLFRGGRVACEDEAAVFLGDRVSFVDAVALTLCVCVADGSWVVLGESGRGEKSYGCDEGLHGGWLSLLCQHLDVGALIDGRGKARTNFLTVECFVLI